MKTSEVSFIIGKVLKISPLSVESRKDTPIVDMGADSLSIVEVTMALEQYFGIDIPDDNLFNVLTPRQFERAVRNQTNRPLKLEKE